MYRYEGWGPNRGTVVPGERAAAYAAARGETEDDFFSGNWIRVEDGGEEAIPWVAAPEEDIVREMVRVWLDFENGVMAVG